MEKTDFIELLHFLHILCWQALGKVANPVSGKPEKNLQFAKRLIDIIETLQLKTKGNLDEDEKKMLDSILTDLRLNYVDEMNKEKSSEEKKEDPQAKKDEQSESEGKNKDNS
ncbi:MAG: DUF1844 domain-containing protein [Candidatus Omnitrophica bacterium]|nr:DUF1844 domain-containing protein [Candidatus Omnitrophota bacterium]MCM8827970.1 DUF1844 domain-containing protein [Candidatus Omnitrophota bacterium]